ncbi:molybdopterin-dependent oxidoreductase [Haliscomenobacter sp.]|uniref:molybdopterin-dependent oxidoreductase n=1 Tax=Haliscomenobacter sp. TaxID=2717303 RepID=UPI00336500E2
MSQTHYRNCNLCEAMCGLEIRLENDQISSIAGDKNDTFSRGHICPKAVALKDIYEDPNRLRTPVKRTPEGWQKISWEEAMDAVVEGIQRSQAQYGHNAVGLYQGNPSIHNLGTIMNSPAFAKALRSKNLFSATSTDQLPHHFASWQLFGHPLLVPIPDIDHTQFMLIIGGNPIASNGSMMTVPDVAKRLRAIQERGGKVVVVDPRRTETAEKADQHFFIRPNADVLLLLAMVQTLFAEGLVNLGHLAEFTDGVTELQDACTAYTPEKVAAATGISAAAIRQLTREFAQAESAVAYGRVGVSTQVYGGLCQWLIDALNILTGNLDKKGGAMFTQPAVDFIARGKYEKRFGRWHSRVRGLPESLGELPVAALAEEILTPGEGQIRTLITSCGNPVLSTPNGAQVDKALASLDFMVSIDIYINETTRHAHIILPPATGLEVSHYDLTFHVLAVRNTAKYSPPLFEKAPDARHDYEIYQELAHRLSGNTEPFQAEPPEEKLDLGLRFGPYALSLDQLKENPHGIDLGPLQACLPQRLFIPDKRIPLAPANFLQDLSRVDQLLAPTHSVHEFPFLLIGRRHLRDNNSWMHNASRLMRGRNRCTLQMHPDDAAQLRLANQQVVKVSSRVGEIELPLEISAEIMPGVVCMPHGYGHARAGVQLDVAKQYAGVSINDLTDEFVLDDLTGNAAFSGVRVNVESKVESTISTF